MSCVLRACGKDFDVNAFTQSSLLEANSVWFRGEKRFPNSTTSEKVNESSGLRITTSDADFSQLELQIKETTAFLRSNESELRKLTAFPGIEVVTIDFGVEIKPPGWASFTFAPALLALAGTIGISLCLSVYPSDGEESADA